MTRPRATEGFFARWSRRKLDHEPEVYAEDEVPEVPRGPHTLPSGGRAPEGAETFADVDFAALDFGSDYRRFLNARVPDEIRNRALNRLWLSHDTISRPDDLDDYLENFSEEAMGIPAELARSAYRVGRGFSDVADIDTPSKAGRIERGTDRQDTESAASASHNRTSEFETSELETSKLDGRGPNDDSAVD